MYSGMGFVIWYFFEQNGPTGILGLYGVDVALLVDLVDRAEAVHVTVTPTQTSLWEPAEE